MVGGKGAHRTSRFIRRLQMSRALGICYSRGMRPASRMRGRDRRRGTWWDREKQCIAIEGQDFAQDTEEGGADRFELIPDYDEGGHNGPSLNGVDDEIVPETEPQDIVAVSKGGHRLGTMLHQWLQIIQEEEQQCARQIATMEQNELTTCSKEEKDHKASAKEDKEHKDNPKAQKEYEDSSKEELHQKASFSDMETDDEASWVEDGVDLRGHSQVEEDSCVQDGVDLCGHSQVEEDSCVQNGENSHGCSHVEGDDFKDKLNELIIAIFPAYKDVLRSGKR